MAPRSWAKIERSTSVLDYDRFPAQRQKDFDRWTIIAIFACALLVTNTSTALISWNVFNNHSSLGYCEIAFQPFYYPNQTISDVF